LTLATSAGKGISLKAATVSAIMESLEVYHAEVADLPSRLASYEQIKKEASVIPLEKLPLRKNGLFQPIGLKAGHLGGFDWAKGNSSSFIFCFYE
jgi:ribosomal protein S12 methylthiotransferase accessory factor